MHASRSTASTGSRSTGGPHGFNSVCVSVCLSGAASNRVRFAGSVSCFTSIAIDRARRSSSPWCEQYASDRSEVQQATACGLPEVFHVSSTASKRRHMAWCCVCMQVNETGHAQRLNTLKQRPRKWFFAKKLTFFHR